MLGLNAFPSPPRPSYVALIPYEHLFGARVERGRELMETASAFSFVNRQRSDLKVETCA